MLVNQLSLSLMFHTSGFDKSLTSDVCKACFAHLIFPAASEGAKPSDTMFPEG